MAWTIEVSERARRQLRKLDAAVAMRIALFLKERVASLEDPRSIGKALQGSLRGTWRYRIGDYRLICKIEDFRVTVVVIEIGHRSDIYD